MHALTHIHKPWALRIILLHHTYALYNDHQICSYTSLKINSLFLRYDFVYADRHSI